MLTWSQEACAVRVVHGVLHDGRRVALGIPQCHPGHLTIWLVGKHACLGEHRVHFLQHPPAHPRERLCNRLTHLLQKAESASCISQTIRFGSTAKVLAKCKLK